MKQFKWIALIGMVALIFAAPAMACEGPGCDSVWVGGENVTNQWQDTFRENFAGGSLQATSGHQDLNMWGAITGDRHGSGYGEYQATAMQAEGLEVTKNITGGEIFNAHTAFQQGTIDIAGHRAHATVNGNNDFGANTHAFANNWNVEGGHGMTMGSGNATNLNMDAEVCLRGPGSAGYESEVIQMTGHYQEMDMPGGSGFTTSLSEQRGYVNVEVSND